MCVSPDCAVTSTQPWPLRSVDSGHDRSCARAVWRQDASANLQVVARFLRCTHRPLSPQPHRSGTRSRHRHRDTERPRMSIPCSGTIRRLGRPRNRQWRTADGAQQGKPSLADVPPRGHEWDAEACPQPRSRTLQHCSSVRARQPRPTLLSARPRRLAMLARSACSCLVGLPKRGERQAVSRGDGMTATQPRLELDWRRAVPTALRRRLARRLRGPFPWDPGVILKPPPCPEGNVRSPPDFVGVGCQKAGTSWWFLLLAQHPGVDVSLLAHKELHYFARFWRDGFTDADAAAYATLSAAGGKAQRRVDPELCLSILDPTVDRRAAPEAKLLVLLRDPVERYRSALNHYATRGRRIDQNLAGEAFNRGLYAMQLGHLIGVVPPEQILVLQYERCRESPTEQLDATYRFLGLTQGFRPEALERKINAAKAVGGYELDLSSRRELVRAYRSDVDRLADLVPTLDRSLWPNF